MLLQLYESEFRREAMIKRSLDHRGASGSCFFCEALVIHWQTDTAWSCQYYPSAHALYLHLDVMLVWRKWNISRTVSLSVLCAIIIVHSGMGSSCRLVDWIVLSSCLV